MFSVYPMTYTLSNVFPPKLKVSHNIREINPKCKKIQRINIAKLHACSESVL